ncbi:MAG TPA: glycosyltransferase [Candidatus Sulfotelmatobacter sp.]|nr:glycosyltransferase [Candidatus Sulfotelmatobacter sp.]
MSQPARTAPRPRLLMVAYYYPPVGGIGAAGSQRVLKFAKYLPASGWSPVVLTVRESAYESYLALDPSLAARLPAGIPTVRTRVLRGLTPLLALRAGLKAKLRGHEALAPAPAPSAPTNGASRSRLQALKDRITDCFEIPDEEMGWLLPGTLRGLIALRRERADAVYATGRPWTGLVIGLLVARLSGRPFVADFRDPWITNPFRLPCSPFRERLEARLESAVIRGARLVIANTDALRDEFRARFPLERPEKFVSLLNGFDPDDFPAAAPPPAGPVTLVHTGFLYLKRDPRTFLEAVARLLASGAVPATDLRLRFVGPVELPYGLEAMASQAGLEQVLELTGRVPYAESLANLRRAHALLLLQPGTTTQVPSKLFEYIGMQKPILAISPPEGATGLLVRRHDLGEVADPDDVPGMAEALARLYRRCRQGGEGLGMPSETLTAFNVRTLTAILAQHLDGLAAGTPALAGPRDVLSPSERTP